MGLNKLILAAQSVSEFLIPTVCSRLWTWLGMYLDWRFLLLIGVDRAGQNRGAGCSCGRPVDSQTGCHLCSDGGHQSHNTQACHSTWMSVLVQEKEDSRRANSHKRGTAASAWPATFYLVFTVPEWTELVQCACLKWVTKLRIYTHQWNTFSLLSKEDDAFRALKPSKSKWHVSARTQHLNFEELSLCLKLGLKSMLRNQLNWSLCINKMLSYLLVSTGMVYQFGRMGIMLRWLFKKKH